MIPHDRMKNILSFVLFTALCAVPVYAQRRDSICGTYYDDMNRTCRINITNDRFYYMESQPVWTGDTLADFEWERAGSQFIEIKYPYKLWGQNIMEATKIVQSYDSSINADSVKFRIVMPETKRMCISVSCGFLDRDYKDANNVERIL